MPPAAESVTASIGPTPGAAVSQPEVAVGFHHVQMYVDSLDDYEAYRTSEEMLNRLAKLVPAGTPVDAAREAWQKLGPPAPPPGEFNPAGQDIVTQLIHGLGWRITGKTELEESHGSRSYVLESQDPRGVKMIVTAQHDGGHQAKKAKSDVYHHFDGASVKRYMENQAGRQGVAVLGFEVNSGEVKAIEARYRAKHPGLLVRLDAPSAVEYGDDGFRVLDVYAYYKGEVGESEPERGTVLRFVQRSEGAKGTLPGIVPVKAAFCGTSCGAYFDHWVSNVVSRTGFLQTLHDTLDFDIKVDFNAGVVAAGEAQIESTVTGNVGEAPGSRDEALVSQSQVFLPINNALSKVGHVHQFLEEIGQGVQHIASRVDDLTEFIHTVNRNRKVTGQGFTFLRIPPSYYGRFTADTLTQLMEPVSAELAAAVEANLQRAGLVDDGGIVKFSTTREAVSAAAAEGLEGALAAELESRRADVATAVVQSQYCNMYKLIGDNLTEEKYLRIVENQILVDIQNGDILYQIFTCNILQRKPGEEAPFLEFIERVCSSKCNLDGTPKGIKPGCGGFGIRNFLTLFLSIEVTKAMNDQRAARESGDARGEELAGKRIEIFAHQLEESNPILTAITDAMTESGDAKERYQFAKTEEERKKALAEFEASEAKLATANAALLECSSRHSEWMNKTVGAV